MLPVLVLTHSDRPITYTDNERPKWVLPNGNPVDAWVSSDNTPGRNIYLWFDAGEESTITLASLRYRVFPFKQPSGGWQSMLDSRKVLRPTPDDPDPFSEGGAEFGAKFKLPVGRYSFEFQLVFNDQPIELRGGSFRVYRNEQASLDHTRAHIQSLFKKEPDTP